MPAAVVTQALAVHRVSVRVRQNLRDPAAERLRAMAYGLGLHPTAVRTAKVYLIEAALTYEQLRSIRHELLADPVTETTDEPTPLAAVVEVHPLPGVTDPAALSVADAIETLIAIRPRVQTARHYEFAGLTQDQARQLAARQLANPVIHRIHLGTYHPAELPAGSPTPFRLAHVPIRDLDDHALLALSKQGHLFLDLAEMHAIQAHFHALGREPTDIELETLAQTWSEHCVHKTLKSTIRYRGLTPNDPIDWARRPGHTLNPDGSVTIHNLLKSTVAAATHELIADGLDWTLSVFVDNAGIVRFDDHHAVCVKVETHNRPSAIEPYGGAATGIGGCIRDIIGTGLAAKPIASTDVFCVATPDIERVPDGCIHPRRTLSEVVAGVRDYGNRMGIPTVNGAVAFDDRYVGNPLVFCGCVGVMPADLIAGKARPGDLIVALGGRTGRDGIHGATFSSGAVTSTHADEFSHAVQIGNAIEEKRLLDAILRARGNGQWARGNGVAADGPDPLPIAQSPFPLFTAITDCGAGGFSSAIGEMGEAVGATVHLDRAPLKYDGLTYTEIWISEAQERMILAVPAENLDALQAICDEEHVELAVLGTFGATNSLGAPELVLHHHGSEVGRLGMHFLHEGIPTPTREAAWSPTASTNKGRLPSDTPSLASALLTLLAHPTIASKHAIIRQYDHEVQGNTIIKPLVGPQGRGPSDAAVIEPVPGSGRGLAIACGLSTSVGDPDLGGDPYHMALAAIDECVRNLVCVGADPARIAILDNFCWPSCAKPHNLAALVRAAEGCYDAAKAYRTPFVSGKDSLNNQFTTNDGRLIEIPPTLLITGIGIVNDIAKCVTSDAKHAGRTLLLIDGGAPSLDRAMRGSHYASIFGVPAETMDTGEGVDLFPRVDLTRGPAAARLVSKLISEGRVHSAHDISDGGLLVTLAEMLIAAGGHLGASIGFQGSGPDSVELFGEAPSRYVLEIDAPETDAAYEALLAMGEESGVWVMDIGHLNDSGVLSVQTSYSGVVSWTVDELARAWLGTVTV